jgi:hypothetical protein
MAINWQVLGHFIIIGVPAVKLFPVLAARGREPVPPSGDRGWPAARNRIPGSEKGRTPPGGPPLSLQSAARPPFMAPAVVAVVSPLVCV